MTSNTIKKHRYSCSELRKLAHQYTNLLLIEPRLIKRIPYPKIKGRARFFLHIIKIFIGTFRHARKQNPCSFRNAKQVCFTASNNQLLNFRKVMKKNDNIHIVHFPGSKAQSEKLSLMVLDAENFIKYFVFLCCKLFINRNAIAKIINKNPYCFDYICDIFFIEFFLNKTKINASTIYICTDLNAFGNLIGKYFLEKQKNVIYVPHSPLMKINNPVFYNSVICRSESEVKERRDWLSKCGVSNIGFILKQKETHKGDGVGILVKPEDSIFELVELIKELNCNIYLRPHPMMNNTKNWEELATQFDFYFSDPYVETSDQFLAKVGTVVGRVSGLHKEMLDIGGQALVVTSDITSDNYDLSSYKNARMFKTWKDAASDICS